MPDTTVELRLPFEAEALPVLCRADDNGVIDAVRSSGGFYERDLILTMRDLLRPDAVALDVGAHVGIVTLALSHLCPDGQVFAFEPAPENFSYLQRNVAGRDNVTAQDLALYDRTGTLSFRFSAAFTAGSFISERAVDEGRVMAVQATRLDDWVERARPSRIDLIKMDVEGAEIRALKGARETLARYRPDLIVELNPITLRRFQQASFRDLLAELRRRFNTIAVITSGRAPVRVLSNAHVEMLLRHEGLLNLLCRSSPGKRPLRSEVNALVGSARHVLSLIKNNNRDGPQNSFVPEPRFDLVPGVDKLKGQPGQLTTFGVRITNRSRSRFSSSAVDHPPPVHLAYRWLDEAGRVVVAEGHRTPFPRPLLPGRATTLQATIQFPESPGLYLLHLTLVQETYAWFDQLDPILHQRLPAVVA